VYAIIDIVRDEDDRGAAGRETLDDRDGLGEGGVRELLESLVEDQQARPRIDVLEDVHEHAVRQRQVLDPRARIDLYPEAPEELRGLLQHLPDIVDRRCLIEVALDEKRLRDERLVEEHVLLMHQLDAVAVGLSDREGGVTRSPYHYFPGGQGDGPVHDPGEGALPRPVLSDHRDDLAGHR
jgi:hypothetical protein